MQITLTGHHVEVTSALKDYVHSKLKRLERHFDHVTTANVVLTVEKVKHKAEATVHISGGQLFADAAHEDMYASIDALVDKLDRQIKRHKEKLTDRHRSKGRQRAHGGMAGE